VSQVGGVDDRQVVEVAQHQDLPLPAWQAGQGEGEPVADDDVVGGVRGDTSVSVAATTPSMPSDLDQAPRLPSSGRVVGFADHGRPGDTAVLWCHGGPGSRNEPAYVAPAAVEAGLRIIGIDRPGYGSSDVAVGRTIGGWVPEALAVADHLGIDRFMTVGISTGGAYALAVAALAPPDRVLAAVPCCSMTDMRYEPAGDVAELPAPRHQAGGAGRNHPLGGERRRLRSGDARRAPNGRLHASLDILDARLRHREPGTHRTFLLEAAPRIDAHIAALAVEDLALENAATQSISALAHHLLTHLGWPTPA
jgi:pimeloyl-ACP methyl ester carboxylesterase